MGCWFLNCWLTCVYTGYMYIYIPTPVHTHISLFSCNTLLTEQCTHFCLISILFFWLYCIVFSFVFRAYIYINFLNVELRLYRLSYHSVLFSLNGSKVTPNVSLALQYLQMNQKCQCRNNTYTGMCCSELSQTYPPVLEHGGSQ